jgi:uncharacterized delta-60 repeat protein
MYKKLCIFFISAMLAGNEAEKANLSFSKDVDLLSDSILELEEENEIVPDEINRKILISNTAISSTSSLGGIELKRSGKYNVINSIYNVPVTGKPVIKITASNVELDMGGFVIDGSLATGSHADMIGIEIASGVSSVSIKNGRIKSIKGIGIKVGAGTDTIALENIIITGCNDSGVEFAGTSGSKIKNATLNNIDISSGDGSQRDTSADAYGLRMEYVTSGSIENCIVHNMVPTGAAKDGLGIYLNACDNLQCVECGMINNKASASTGSITSGGWGDSETGKVLNTNVTAFYDIYVSSDISYAIGQATSGNAVGNAVLIKYTSSGAIDTGWASSGTVEETGAVFWEGIAIDASGNIYVSGQNGSAQGVVAKYSSGGVLVSGWGSSGKVTDTAITQWNSIAVDSSNNIYVSGANTSNQGVVAKYDSNGALDGTFGASGKVTDTAVSYWNGIAIDSSNNSYVAGQNTSSRGVAAKYNSSGVLDSGWGSSGKVTDTVVSRWQDIAIDGSPNSYVCGQDTSNQGVAAKYNSSGAVVTGWGSSGKVTDTAVDIWNGLVVDSSGNSYVTGAVNNAGNDDGITVKYNSSGALDSGWASSGKITSTDIATWGGVFVESSKTYIAGNNSTTNGTIRKYKTDGTLDTGTSTTTYGSGKGLFLTGSTKNCIFSNCFINNISGNSQGSAYGFYLDSANNCLFKNCEALTNDGANNTSTVSGFRLESASTNNRFVDCISSGHTVSGTTSTVYGWQVASNNNRFSNCTGSEIGSSSGGVAYGFYFSSVSSNRLLNCEAISNEASGATNCYGFYSTAGNSNLFESCKGSANKTATGICAGIALDAAETLSTIYKGEYSSNQVTSTGSCYGIVLDPSNSSGVSKCVIRDNQANMNLATANTATLAGFRDFTSDSNSLISGNVFALNGNAVLSIGSAPDYNIDSSDLTIDGSGNGGLNMYLTYDSGQNAADMFVETSVSNMQALSTSLMGWTNLLIVPQQS